MKNNMPPINLTSLTPVQLAALRTLMESRGFTNLLEKLAEPFILEIEGLRICCVESKAVSSSASGSWFFPGERHYQIPNRPLAGSSILPMTHERRCVTQSALLDLFNLPKFRALLHCCTRPVVVHVGDLEFTFSEPTEDDLRNMQLGSPTDAGRTRK